MEALSSTSLNLPHQRLLDPAGYAVLLRQCKSLREGRHLHSKIVESGHDADALMSAQVMQMYRRFGRADEVLKVFDSLQQRDEYSWNILIAANAEKGDLREARRLFDAMPEKSVVSWNTLITAYSRRGLVHEAKRLFDAMPRRDPVSWSAIITAFAQNGQISEARSLFDCMPSRSLATWNAIIAGYAHSGQSREAIDMFFAMDVDPSRVTFLSVLQACHSPAWLPHGKRIHARCTAGGHDRVVLVGNALVSMYGRCGSLYDALATFHGMPRKSVQTWNALASVYHWNGKHRDALGVLARMDLEGICPDEVTLVCMLDACTSINDGARGHDICGRAIACGYLSVVKVANGMVNMYGKAGSLDRASWVFDSMPSRDVITWTALIVAYAVNGQGSKATEVFRKMSQEGVVVDKVVFLSIISACVHAGALRDAWDYFGLIQDYGVTETLEHYSCMVDALARAGQLVDAEDLLNHMPFEPDGSAARALLSACRTSRKDVRTGSKLARVSMSTDPSLASSYTLLTNICEGT